MHTDEYEISLSREIDVCKSAIAKAEKRLTGIEKKHDLQADVLAGGVGCAKSPEPSEAYSRWLDTYEGLLRWREKLTQYEELLRAMKQSISEKR